MFITQALSFYNFYNLLKRFELNWFSALVNLEQVGARSQIFGALFTALTWPKLKISLIIPTASAPFLPQPQSLPSHVALSAYPSMLIPALLPGLSLSIYLPLSLSLYYIFLSERKIL